VSDPYMRIHGMAPALNYGQQAYEGLKAFRLPGDSTISIFRPDRNAARLQYSADFISIPPVPTELFLSAVKAAVALNAEFVPPHETGAAMYIRPQIYGSSAQLGLNPPEEYTFCVYVLPTGVYHGTHPVKALIMDEFDRAAPNGTGSAKVGGNYAPVLRWSERARNEGYGITLHLDSKVHEEVDEFSTSGFIGALVDGEDVTLVVPDSKAVINSVTSDSVQEIGKSFGWKVERRPVSLGFFLFPGFLFFRAWVGLEFWYYVPAVVITARPLRGPRPQSRAFQGRVAQPARWATISPPILPPDPHPSPSIRCFDQPGS